MTDTITIPGGFPAIPPNVAKALSEVMGKAKTLGKDEKNPFANYKYAGIESFLEMLRPLCAEAGLIVLQDEEDYEFREAADKGGKLLTWLVMTFAFGLAHSSGETWDCRIRRTAMAQASMGSQAFGAAQSYALKSFLRSIGLIATGDTEDADSHEQTDLPKTKAKPKADAREPYGRIVSKFYECKSRAELEACYAENADEIATIPPDWLTHLRRDYKRILEGLPE